MKYMITIVFLFLFACLVACGEGSSTEKITEVSYSGIDAVADISMLPACSATNEGDMVWVKDEATPRLCSDGKWYAIAKGSVATTCHSESLPDASGIKVICGGGSIGVILNGQDGLDGAQGRQGENGEDGDAGKDGIAGADGQKGADGKDGVDGKDGKDGTPGTAGKDGNDGKDGTPGTDGKSGTDGKDGTDGTSCTLEKIDAQLVRVICGADSAILYSGEPGDSMAQGEVVLDSEKIAIPLDEVTGVTQKGPFLSGSKVLVREMEDGRTLTQTGNSFNGKILNDKGEFKINARMLVSQYVMLEATGYYRNEVTGKNSNSELTLFAISDVNDRNTVNVNLLTHLEYERVVYLVTKMGMKVNAAKKQAQKEVFGLLNIDAAGFSNSEDLSVTGSSDEDGALLAFSLMFQGDRSVAELSELLTKIATDMEQDGIWNDDATKMSIAEWSADADSAGRLESIRNNVKNWGISAMVPNFEQYVRRYWPEEYGLDTCSDAKIGMVQSAKAGKRKDTKTRYICKDMDGDMRWLVATDIEKDTVGWKDSVDGALKVGNLSGRTYVFDETGSLNGIKGWRYAEGYVENHFGGCREALYGTVRTDSSFALDYICNEASHKWERYASYQVIDDSKWPDSTDGAVKWVDSVNYEGVATKYCYVWDESPDYGSWRLGDSLDCALGLLGCTAKRVGEIRKAKNAQFYECQKFEAYSYYPDRSPFVWRELYIVDYYVYVNTYLYRCTEDSVGENIYKDGDMVYGIDAYKSRFVCENGTWRAASTREEKYGHVCTAKLQGEILGDSITCDEGRWRITNFYDYPVDKDWTNPEISYGTLIDDRDGRSYKTVVVNGLNVMAENLKYADSITSPYLKGQTSCYDDDSLNCLKGGRMYSWSAVMDVDSKWNDANPSGDADTIGNPHQGICPRGWHVPSISELETLFNGNYKDYQVKGLRFDWSDATNTTGLSVLPTDSFEDSDRLGAWFWSATVDTDHGNQAEIYCFESYNSVYSFGRFGFTRSDGKGAMLPIRCIEDQGIEP